MKNITTEYGISKDLSNRIITAIEHDLKSQVCKLFPDLHSADQADIIYHMDSEQRQKLIKMLGNKFDPEVLIQLEGEVKEEIISLLDAEDVAKALTKLDTDDAVEIIEMIASEGRDGLGVILNTLKAKRREEIEEALSYGEDTVGRLMMPKSYIAAPSDWTVGEVTKYIKSKRNLPSFFQDVVVVDEDFKPMKTVSLGQIIKGKENQPIIEIADDSQKELITLTPSLTEKEAAKIFTKYDLHLAPVIDEKGVLVGVIWLQDIIDVIDEQADEDILHLGNVHEADMYANVFSSAKGRFPWLITSLFTTTLSATIVSLFEGTIQQNVSLAILMPIVAALGGTASIQSLTVLIRNLGDRDIQGKIAAKVVGREMIMGMINGIVIAALAGTAVFLWKGNLVLATIFSTTLMFTVTMSGLLGTFIPLLLNKMKLDPAITSSTFITTTLDALSFFVFLFLATKLLL